MVILQFLPGRSSRDPAPRRPSDFIWCFGSVRVASPISPCVRAVFLSMCMFAVSISLMMRIFTLILAVRIFMLVVIVRISMSIVIVFCLLLGLFFLGPVCARTQNVL